VKSQLEYFSSLDYCTVHCHSKGEVCTGCSARIHLYCAEKLFNER